MSEKENFLKVSCQHVGSLVCSMQKQKETLASYLPQYSSTSAFLHSNFFFPNPHKSIPHILRLRSGAAGGRAMAEAYSGSLFKGSFYCHRSFLGRFSVYETTKNPLNISP